MAQQANEEDAKVGALVRQMRAGWALTCGKSFGPETTVFGDVTWLVFEEREDGHMIVHGEGPTPLAALETALASSPSDVVNIKAKAEPEE